MRLLRPPFGLRFEGFLDRPGMYLHPETLMKTGGEFGRFELRIGSEEFLEAVEDLWSEFARLFGPRLRGNNPGVLVLEVLLSLIDSRPGETEIAGSSSNRIAVGLQRRQGFVFELEQIFGIEELNAGRSDGGLAAKRALKVPAAGRPLAVVSAEMPEAYCKYIYAAYSRNISWLST